jgi:hypothetical protein
MSGAGADSPAEGPARPERAPATGSPPDIPPPAPPPGASRYGWFVGLVAILIIAYITINTATTPSLGSRGVTPGRPLPPFAVPLALSDLQGDANVATRIGQGALGRQPACTVRSPRVLNICQIAAAGPVALGLFIPAGDCSRVLDELASLEGTGAFPGLQIVGVAVKGGRSDVRKLVHAHGWLFPVGYDRDGALATVYRMGLVCSTITLALPGGKVYGPALLGVPTVAVLRARLTALESAARAGGWRPPA